MRVRCLRRRVERDGAVSDEPLPLGGHKPIALSHIYVAFLEGRCPGAGVCQRLTRQFWLGILGPSSCGDLTEGTSFDLVRARQKLVVASHARKPAVTQRGPWMRFRGR